MNRSEYSALFLVATIQIAKTDHYAYGRTAVDDYIKNHLIIQDWNDYDKKDLEEISDKTKKRAVDDLKNTNLITSSVNAHYEIDKILKLKEDED